MPPVDEVTRAFRARMVAKAKSIAEQLAAQAPPPVSSGEEWTAPLPSTVGVTAVSSAHPYVGPLGDRLRQAEEAQAEAEARRAPPGQGVDATYRGALGTKLREAERAQEAARERAKLAEPSAFRVTCPCGVWLSVERGADVTRHLVGHGWIGGRGGQWFCSLMHAAQLSMSAPAPAALATLAELGRPRPNNPRGAAIWEQEQADLRARAYDPPAPPPAPAPRSKGR